MDTELYPSESQILPVRGDDRWIHAKKKSVIDLSNDECDTGLVKNNVKQADQQVKILYPMFSS
jgi:hypothetical protein